MNPDTSGTTCCQSRLSHGLILNHRVVVVCGVSGSGKTFLSKEVERLGYCRLSSDEIAWRIYGDGLPGMEPEKQRNAYVNANQSMVSELTARLADGQAVVVDSTMCRRAKRDEVRNVCGNFGVIPLFIYLDVPLDELNRRMSDRRGNGPNDQIVDAIRLATFFANFERPEDDENITVLKFNGNMQSSLGIFD